MCRLSFAFFLVSHVFLSTRTVEATTLNSRCYNLQPQDEFLRDNMSEEDILIVSIGGNDVACGASVDELFEGVDDIVNSLDEKVESSIGFLTIKYPSRRVQFHAQFERFNQ